MEVSIRVDEALFHSLRIYLDLVIFSRFFWKYFSEILHSYKEERENGLENLKIRLTIFVMKGNTINLGNLTQEMHCSFKAFRRKGDDIMNFRRLTILVIALMLVFISQGCLPPPPPPWSSPYHHHDHLGRHRHWSSLEQPVQSVAQLTDRNAEEVGTQGVEVS
jgi:hypothetical protein